MSTFNLRRLFIVIVALLGTSVAIALPVAPKDLKNYISSGQDDLLHQVYVYQEQPMMTANWLYIGYAPRMNDPARVKVVISKQGFTMRVNMLMTEQEVAQYPKYLLDRSRSIDSTLANYGVSYDSQSSTYRHVQSPSSKYYLEIPQLHRLNNYKVNVERVAGDLNDETFNSGLALLELFFPQNVKVVQRSGQRMVEANFVYPITITKFGLVRPLNKVFPQAKTYYTFSLDERRSEHNEYTKVNGRTVRTGRVADDLFDGFPAFWIDPGGRGTGVHGPIRYSEPTDNQGQMPNFWRDNNYLDQHQGIDPTRGLNVRYRFEVIRTANSAACFRSEPMELRALLPSSLDAIKQVPFVVIDQFDKVDGYNVDVDYYTDNHYRKANRYAWYKKHYLTYRERQMSENDQVAILEDRLTRTKIFPYLDPASLEFKLIGYGVDPHATRRYRNGMATYNIQKRKYERAVEAYNNHYVTRPRGGIFGGFNRELRDWQSKAEELLNAIPSEPLAPVQPTLQDWYPVAAPRIMGTLNRAPY